MKKSNADLRMNSFLGAGLVQLALEPSQYLDKTLYEVFDTDDPSFPPIAAHLRSLKGESARYELNFEQQEFDVRVEPLREAQNQIVGCIGVGLDITERKRAERHIRFQANVLSQVNDAVIAVDNEQRITYWNNGSQRLYNVTSDEVLGRALDVAYQYRWLRAEDEKAANDSLTATGAWHGENIHIKKSGEEVFVESSVSVLKDKSGANIGLLAVIRNITERKQASQKMQEQAALLDIATDAILVRDLENKIVFWNKGAERLYGWTVELALGKDVYKLLYKASEPKLKEAHKTVAECSSWQGELHQVTKSGQEIVIESRWTPMLDEQGQLKSVLVVNTDITENKQLEAQFLRAQRLESLGTLASGIAHDLNNILTPILATAQLLPLKLPYANQQSQHLLQMLEINAKRGAAVVKQVLSFARGVESQRQNFQLRHLITEIQHVVKATFPKSIELDTDIAPDLWLISGDITQLHQVLMNLVVNARDAMPSSGTLKLCAENLFIDQNYARMHLDAQVGPYIVINVADTGTGMPTEILERIFEPFFTTKPVGSGTGLGLSTVISIIKSHGGFVNVESSVGQGTQFKVYLPAVAGTETLAASDLELPTGHGELIFVVDDELAIREITKITLETHSYKVLTVSDGFEAIALYAQYQHEISAVLMDIIMPSIDGPTAIRILQKINPHVLIIAVSGLASNQKIAEAAGSGVKAFLSKPYTAMELLTTINAVLIAP